jgi:hypothetical protein
VDNTIEHFQGPAAHKCGKKHNIFSPWFLLVLNKFSKSFEVHDNQLQNPFQSGKLST